MSNDLSQGLTSIYVLLLLGVGLFAGVAVGAVMDNFTSNGLLIGLVAGVVSVVVAGQARHFATKVFPAGTVPDTGANKFPRVVVINTVLVSLIGGLAGHDLSHEAGNSTGLIIGGLAGLFSTLSMLVLMVTYFYRGPETEIRPFAATHAK